MVRAGSFSAWTERQRDRERETCIGRFFCRPGLKPGHPRPNEDARVRFLVGHTRLRIPRKGTGACFLACKPIKLRVPWTFQPRGGALLLVDAAQWTRISPTSSSCASVVPRIWIVHLSFVQGAALLASFLAGLADRRGTAKEEETTPTKEGLKRRKRTPESRKNDRPV